MFALLLLACAPSADKPDTGGDDTAPPLETGLESDSDLVECTLLGGIALSSERTPGEDVQVAVTLGNEVPGVEVTWWVEAGTLAPDTGTNVTWTLPTDVAAHRPRQLQIEATATAPGCLTEILPDAITVDWPESRRVVVVYDPGVSGSEDVARAYAASRDVPDEALCAVASPDATTLDAAAWPAFVDAVQACIDAVGAQVMYVVPVYGVPYKVAGLVPDIGYPENLATVSLDALLAYGSDSRDAPTAVYNPVYQAGSSATASYDPYLPFGELRAGLRAYDHLYLVARIDGADADAALALIDRTEAARAAAETRTLSGTVYVDGNYGGATPATDDFGSYDGGQWNMIGTAAVFADDGRYPVVWDDNSAEFGTDPAPLTCPDALYYAGWYSYYNYNDVFAWTVGAIGGHLDSCSACDIRAPGTWSGTALQRGITATFGAVSEPYVAGMPEYDQFFLYLLQGASYGEAAYESTVVGRWMMVWVGDPLYRPYPADGS